jgi:hypothetical protein
LFLIIAARHVELGMVLGNVYNELTALYRMLVEIVTVAQLVEKFLAIFGT